MIHSVLQVLSKDLDTFLRNRTNGRDDVVVLSGLMNNLDGSFAVVTEDRVIFSLYNIEQERINLNAPMNKKAMTNPPFNLNLYVLVSAFYSPLRYKDALRMLSLTLGYFQGKQVFTPENTPGLTSIVDKLTVELVNMDNKDASNFWTAFGAKHLPSFLCKIKMVSITADVILEEVGEIRGIDLTLKHSVS